jgi:hypothetical protein
MRLEVELIEGGGASPAPDLPRLPITRRRRGMDRFDLSVLSVFALLSLAVLALDLWQVFVHNRVWTGTDGVYIVDQMQYVAWITDASHHFLVSNLFVLHSTPNDYFQPAVVISGGLTALGMAPWLALLLWKPVAVAGFFFGTRAYVRRSMSGVWARRAALVLALFFGSFTLVYGNWSVLGDLFPNFLSWGYTFGLMALAGMVWALVCYQDALTHNRRFWLPGLLGFVITLLHPWNGELLIALVVAAELLMVLLGQRLDRRRLKLAALTIGGTAAALLYYAILGKTDESWKLAQLASKHAWSFWSIALAILPLLLPAALAYRRRPKTFLDAATRTWPLAAFAIFVLSGTSIGATPLHSFQGITVPLGVLAVDGLASVGWRRLPRPVLVASVLIALFTIPTTVEELKIAHQLASPTPNNGNFITHDENSALTYLAKDPESGSVLTRSYLGAVVPGRTGRRTYVGDCLWSEPSCLGRTSTMQTLFQGSMTPEAARKFVLTSGARFVLADCQTTANLNELLGPLIRSEHGFGCATVYEVE